MFKKILAFNFATLTVLATALYLVFYIPLTSSQDLLHLGNSSKFGTHNKYTFASKLKADELKVMTYNVHGLPHTYSPTCDNLIGVGKNLAKLRSSSDGPDIVAIQEGFHEKTLEMIKLSGYRYYAKGPGIDYEATKISSGLWLLSNYPIKNIKTMTYDSCATWDCFSNKGVQLAIVELGDSRKIEIYNTHMNAYSEYDPWTDRKEIDKAKVKQIRQLRNFIFNTHDKNLASIVLGDFNFVQNSPFYSMFVFPDLINSIIHVAGEMPKKLLDHQYIIQGNSLNLIPKAFRKLFSNKKYSDHSAIEIKYSME
jgi:endonuclease/exonuclease/phosphatase family metal-dependent hydrolase